jgi:hypothetical protein
MSLGWQDVVALLAVLAAAGYVVARFAPRRSKSSAGGCASGGCGGCPMGEGNGGPARCPDTPIVPGIGTPPGRR